MGRGSASGFMKSVGGRAREGRVTYRTPALTLSIVFQWTEEREDSAGKVTDGEGRT